MLDYYQRIRTLCRLRQTTIDQMMKTLYPSENNPKEIYNGWRRRNLFPRCDVALKMAEYLNVSVEYLVTGNEKNSENDFAYKYGQYEELLEEISKLSTANYNLIKGTVYAMNHSTKSN